MAVFMDVLFGDTSSMLTLVIAALNITLLVTGLYRISPLHGLYRVPGPLICRVSAIPHFYHSMIGDEATWISKLHQIYGTTIRIAPGTVDISDGKALHDIYVANGGFHKSKIYHNFSPDGKHLALFSETDPAKRQIPIRAIGGVFAMSTVKACTDQTMVLASEMVRILKLARQQSLVNGEKIDVLGLSRSFAADAASINVLGQKWDCLERCATIVNSSELSKGLRGDGLLDFYDAIGTYWLLPPWLYTTLETIRLPFAGKATQDSFNRLWGHVGKEVSDAKTDLEKARGSFQERLLRAGLSEAETAAQAADAMFAGIETTGFNLGVTVWHLVKNPTVMEKIKAEIKSAGRSADIHALTYLDAVVVEGLRISEAVPTRFPRVVPANGWTFNDLDLPGGTEVSCTVKQLHLNPDVYANPNSFLPERWLDPTEEMKRDWLPFGLGARRCVAKGLAMMEMKCVIYALAIEDALVGSHCCAERIELIEWFSAKVVGGRIDLSWTKN